MADANAGERQRKWRKEHAEHLKLYKKDYLRQKYLAEFIAEHGSTPPREERTGKNDWQPRLEREAPKGR